MRFSSTPTFNPDWFYQTTMTDATEDSGINITLGKLVSYPAGVLLTLLGILYILSTVFIGGVLITVGGLLALPVVRRRIKNETGISANRWATVAIVLVLAVGGFAVVPTDSDSSNSTGDSGDSELITSNATSLVPTVDDFEPGWRSQGVEDGTGDFYDFENENSLFYNVTVYDSVEEAEAAFEAQKPERSSLGDADYGDEAYRYIPVTGVYEIRFRKSNVVCITRMQNGYNPGDRVYEYAEKCENTISQHQ